MAACAWLFRSAHFFTILFTLTMAACGALTTQITAANSPTTTPSSVPTILPTPLSSVPFDERQHATIHINHPDEIAFVQGFIWVKTDDGHVIQIDPSTDRIVGDIKVDTTTDPYHYCQGLGTDGENIWACSASGDEDNRGIDVVRIDPQSQDIVATIKIDKVFDQLELPFLSNHIWVLSDGGGQLIGIDVTSNQPGPVIDLGARCFQLAAIDMSLLATCTLENLILRIDPAKGEVSTRVTLKDPRYIAVTENGVWVGQSNAVVRLDSKSLNPMIVFTNLPGVWPAGDIFATGEAVWVRQESVFLYRIDPTSNELVEQIQLDQSLSGGSVLATSDSVWLTANDDNLLIRLRLK